MQPSCSGCSAAFSATSKGPSGRLQGSKVTGQQVHSILQPGLSASRLLLPAIVIVAAAALVVVLLLLLVCCANKQHADRVVYKPKHHQGSPCLLRQGVWELASEAIVITAAAGGSPVTIAAG